jgi:ATP-dependent helicase HrpB
MLKELPIDSILPAVTDFLHTGTSCVVNAPLGSGKTTRVPPALMDAPWLDGRKIIMLEPRRLAARAAARHMAGLLGEKVGERIGYRTRLDTRVSPKTQVEVVTEGVLTRILQHDPELSPYACVIFDEFHERSLHADLGLTLCLDARTLRPDLRLIIMSATLDTELMAELLEDASVFSCAGHPYPVETRYLRLPGQNLEERMVRAVRHALDTETGDILVFLPGAGEIRRTAELLDDLDPTVVVLPLFGALSADQQDAALAPAPGRRKVILATSIAETSLTIDGVRVVVDSGLARLPRFDPGSGMTRLVTEPASLATADQRRGRAGRTQPGVAFRVWDQADEISRKPFPAPEILDADLTQTALDLALWGTPDPDRLTWPTPPPAGNFAGAVRLLQRLGAVDEACRITAHGHALARLPVHPRLANMLLAAQKRGLASTAAHLAVLLFEPAGRDPDLRDALSVLPPHLVQAGNQLLRLIDAPAGTVRPETVGMLTALAYPDRVARRQEDGSYRLAGGRKVVWPRPTPLSGCEFLAVAHVDGNADRTRIRQAAPLSAAELEDLFGHEMRMEEGAYFDPVRERAVSTRKRMLWALCLAEEPAETESGILTNVLLAHTRLEQLPWDRESRGLRDRVRFLHGMSPQDWPDFSDDRLHKTMTDWLGPFVPGARSRSDLNKAPLTEALKNLIGHGRLNELDRLAPTRITVPSGAHRAVDYSPDSGPVLPVKLQEMFGCTTTPTLAGGRYALTLHLLSPAGRPLHITRDLPSFWENGYPSVRAEMRGRYPKHPWPENPLTAQPTAKTKKYQK